MTAPTLEAELRQAIETSSSYSIISPRWRRIA